MGASVFDCLFNSALLRGVHHVAVRLKQRRAVDLHRSGKSQTSQSPERKHCASRPSATAEYKDQIGAVLIV